jgi:hypothetical protein
LGCGTRGFTSIPTVWYFICATMTTVGYGDHYPLGMEGKFVAGCCMLCGIMVLALPINVIGMVRRKWPGVDGATLCSVA